MPMPSYAPDAGLLIAARLYTDEVHASVKKRAAHALSVDYHMFRRLLASGSVSPENRQKVRNGLRKAGYDSAKGHKIAHEIPVDVTRSMLTQLLQALDAYQGVGPTALGQPE